MGSIWLDEATCFEKLPVTFQLSCHYCFHVYDVDVYACVEVQKVLHVVEISSHSRQRQAELEMVKLPGEQTCGELKQTTR